MGLIRVQESLRGGVPSLMWILYPGSDGVTIGATGAISYGRSDGRHVSPSPRLIRDGNTSVLIICHKRKLGPIFDVERYFFGGLKL